ncbi:hypothetical protein CRENPOLYSF1_80021 [Crenothrix polyspora]|uniref:Uncharacterized protein n=1 Tax=Crenothrix polyspora TaxID=360316 RepID=A0A1R4HIL9_9GAMM|nr:hypothetical protein CRENPOLYSF1_80021 [Crenothrix polyspora]
MSSAGTKARKLVKHWVILCLPAQTTDQAISLSSSILFVNTAFYD